MTAGARIPLTRDRVLRAAVAIADDGGLDGLTMRRLGQALGVEAMSLYNHVANKAEIHDGMLDLVIGEFELPSAGPDWRQGMRASALSAYRTLVRHPWAASLMVGMPAGRRSPVTRDTRPQVGPAQRRYMDSMLGHLRDAGFSVELTHHAYHAIDGHITGFTLQQVNFPIPSGDLAAVGTSFLGMLPADEYPHLAEHIQGHVDGAYAGRGGFSFGLDLILDGLERLRTAPGAVG
jgi:AcrR family transcriptional regulator